MSKSFGTVLVNPEVGLLFISFERDRAAQLRSRRRASYLGTISSTTS